MYDLMEMRSIDVAERERERKLKKKNEKRDFNALHVTFGESL